MEIPLLNDINLARPTRNDLNKHMLQLTQNNINDGITHPKISQT